MKHLKKYQTHPNTSWPQRFANQCEPQMTLLGYIDWTQYSIYSMIWFIIHNNHFNSPGTLSRERLAFTWGHAFSLVKRGSLHKCWKFLWPSFGWCVAKPSPCRDACLAARCATSLFFLEVQHARQTHQQWCDQLSWRKPWGHHRLALEHFHFGNLQSLQS